MRMGRSFCTQPSGLLTTKTSFILFSANSWLTSSQTFAAADMQEVSGAAGQMCSSCDSKGSECRGRGADSCAKYLWIFAGKSDTHKHLADYRCVTMLTQTHHDKAETEKARYINWYIYTHTHTHTHTHTYGVFSTSMVWMISQCNLEKDFYGTL